MNTVILSVPPQWLNTVIWEEIHTQLGQQARIPLEEKNQKKQVDFIFFLPFL